MHMLLSKSLAIKLMAVVLLACYDLALVVQVQSVHALAVYPLLPVRWVVHYYIGGEDTVASRVLHVDVYVSALHREHNVQVDL